MSEKQFLGTDLKLNGDRLAVDETGDIAIEVGGNCLAANLTDVVYSSNMERVRHPDWGAGLEDYVSERFDEAKKAELLARIIEYIKRDSRVKEVKEAVILDSEDILTPNRKYLRVSLETVDGQPDLNLVWPFDLEV